MKSLPPKFLESLEGIEGFNKEAFLEVHDSGEQITSIRINLGKSADGKRETISASLNSSELLPPEDSLTHHSPLTTRQPVPWTEYGFYLKQRPSFT
ncbi:MAG: hypothetical protein ACXVBX_09755, partial [Flavisolibacter sp.]